MERIRMAQTMPTGIVAVCPRCRGTLDSRSTNIECIRCGSAYSRLNGFPDLIVGGRFDDEADEARSSYETSSNEYLTRNYLLPTFRRRLEGIRTPRLLSLGCGVGIDVDLLTEEGWDMAGIDCGNRTVEWPARLNRERLYLANGKALPFEDRTFDLVYCGCVFPHVGVDGDSNRVLADYREQRLQIAREMIRVLKPGARSWSAAPIACSLSICFTAAARISHYPAGTRRQAISCSRRAIIGVCLARRAALSSSCSQSTATGVFFERARAGRGVWSRGRCVAYSISFQPMHSNSCEDR